MRTSAKIVTLFVVLVICMPTHGEILIYNKIMKGFMADGEGVTNPNNTNIVNWNWIAGKRVDRGFLILDVEFDSNAHIAGINKATQVEYWKNGHEKYYEQISHNFVIERIESDKTTYWVLRDISASEEDQVSIFMVEGEARMNNIGLGSKENRREIPSKLKGSVLTFLYDENEYLHFNYEEILNVSLRLNQHWTRLANLYWEIYDPSIDEYNPYEWAEGGIDNEGVLYGIVKEWLIGHGYNEGDQGNGVIYDGSQDEGDQDEGDDDGDGFPSGIIFF
jgi:hypothetical protein